MPILNLNACPVDPIEALIWLGGVKEQVALELEQTLAEAYYSARLRQQLELAIEVGPYARKRVLALTRRENEKRGRTVRWGDHLDPSSTAYDPAYYGD